MIKGIDVLEALAAAFAVMFAVAAAVKISGRGSWTEVAHRVVPDSPRMAMATMITLPLCELGTAALLVLAPAAGLIAAAVVLAAFASVIALRSADLAGSECGCFGSLMPSTIGPGLIVRNLVMASVAAGGAALAVSGGTTSPGLAELGIASIALGAGAFLVKAFSGPAVGPRRGTRAVVPGLGSGRPALLVFLLPGCPACSSAAPALDALSDEHLDLSVIAAIGSGPEESRAELAATFGTRARFDLAGLMNRWNVSMAPFVVAIDASGKVIDSAPGARRATLERMAFAAVEGRRAPADATLARPEVSPLERMLASLTRREAVAAIGATALLPALAGTSVASIASGSPRRRRQLSPPKPKIVPVKGTCNDFFKFKLPLEYCQNENSGGCTLYDGFLDKDNKKIGSRDVAYDEVITKKGGVYCPTCATEGGADTCFKDAPECVSKCKAKIGACSGRCGSTCNEQVCIEAVSTQELVPKFKVILTQWKPSKNLSKKCKGYADQLNEEIRTHEVDGHLARSLKSVESANKGNLQNQTFKYCAPTEAEARAQVNAAKERAVDRARQDFRERFIAANDGFHHTEAGKNLQFCCTTMCGGGHEDKGCSTSQPAGSGGGRANA